jgi:hypothetical protein
MGPNNGQISTINAPFAMDNLTNSFVALVWELNAVGAQSDTTFTSTGSGGFFGSVVSALK